MELMETSAKSNWFKQIPEESNTSISIGVNTGKNSTLAKKNTMSIPLQPNNHQFRLELVPCSKESTRDKIAMVMSHITSSKEA
jgi:hypothetical protein